MTATSDYQLTDRWTPEAEGFVLTGVQAIGRMLLEQRARDRAAGLRTATFVSGYQGSPLAGLDRVLTGIPGLRDVHEIHLVPGVNEELAATSVWGSQLSLPGATRTHDGVLGVWFGKAPGLDRACDAIRHGHHIGASPTGGVLALVGDDPACKSSTLPSASERTLAALQMPVLFPRDAADVIRLGQYGFALSRASGCWMGVKIVADVADGVWTAHRSEPQPLVVPQIEWAGAPWTYTQGILPVPPLSLAGEQELAGPRWAMVRAFADANPVDSVIASAREAWLTILSVGTATSAVLTALAGLGLGEADLERRGVRLIHVAMPYPLAEGTVQRAAAGVESVLVVEEKGGFVEAQLREALYGQAHTPAVLGQRDSAGQVLAPNYGELTSDRVADILRRVLGDRVELKRPERERTPLTLLPSSRTSYFCSGCPHNRSTVVPDGSLAAGGIGCHGMAAGLGRPSSAVVGMTQMGGEGTQWIGQAPFNGIDHIFQNVGDGTFFHSGQLAVQACIAAGVNITYKVLYNSTVAMTGGQDAQGAIAVPALTRKLAAEGVSRIIVCAEDPKKYGRQAGFAPGVDVWHRDRLDEAQRALREVPGVTVLIYDQQCAAEARRERKRGLQPQPTRRVVINEAVCEGCGDCGRKSNCLSVEPVETPFGRKTRIDQTSCNSDYSCLDGDCPSFVTVESAPRRKEKRTAPTAPEAPEPVLPALDETYEVLLAGIGGTGIVTVNQILSTAALLDGLDAAGLDQTGLSQKAGPVTSHLLLSRASSPSTNRVSEGGVRCYLAFDPLVGADTKPLAFVNAVLTRSFVSTSRPPTGAMAFNPEASAPDAVALEARIASATAEVTSLDTLGAARALFDSTATANLLLVGAAYQSGALPISGASIERAIELNGVAVEANIAAFRWGRARVAHPDTFDRYAAQRTKTRATRPTYDLQASPLQGEVRDAVALRAADLVRYQGKKLARSYVADVEEVWLAERRVGDATSLSLAAARGLHRVLAYKDEYEVAALLTDPSFAATLDEQVPGSTRLRFHLHPPVLRALGMKNKMSIGPAGVPALRALARAKSLRGTALDPFGKTQTRRAERELIADYRDLLELLTRRLTRQNYELATQLAQLVESVRGYEEIKLRAIDAYQQRKVELLGQLTG